MSAYGLVLFSGRPSLIPAIISLSPSHRTAFHTSVCCESFVLFEQLFTYFIHLLYIRGFLGGASGKEPTCQCKRHKRLRFDPWVRKSPWRRAWQPTPVFLPGKPYGQRSLAGYNPKGHKESDTTEAIEHACIALHVLLQSVLT